jgi:valyl-tRNA synthetase
MVIMGINNLNQVPFQSVFIHPKILDGNGETMSKSKGNGIDPLDVIDKFGADALRFGMANLTTETQDVRMPVQYECPVPDCQQAIPQTVKNRVMPVVQCPKCKQNFRTQWAESETDLALPRGPVISERFEVARNFVNKLWNASRFAMLNLEGYQAGAIQESDLTVEDRWILSRLHTVSKKVTQSLEHYRYAEATRELYDFAWDNFCSFFVEILKDRFADPQRRPHAQRILVFALDQLLRMLHPVMPFVTEAIWEQLNRFAQTRGLETVEPACDCLIGAAWVAIDQKWFSPEIETQFARFQSGLGSLREIRSRQNLPPKKDIKFVIRCDQSYAASLQPMAGYFKSMASAELVAMGPEVEAPEINALIAQNGIEIFVDLEGLIDVSAEIKRLEKEQKKLAGNIGGKEKKLANEKFVNSAPAEIVQRERDSLEQLKQQLTKVESALKKLSKA